MTAWIRNVWSEVMAAWIRNVWSEEMAAWIRNVWSEVMAAWIRNVWSEVMAAHVNAQPCASTLTCISMDLMRLPDSSVVSMAWTWLSGVTLIGD